MRDDVFDLIVVGGGAAGFFGAIRTTELKRGATVLILEKSNKLLSKVKVSGGGRCNVTHNEFDPGLLSHHYPRGEKQLRSAFKSFHVKDTVSWFQEKGIQLKTEPDGRMFPVTNDSQTIINCFLQEAISNKIKIEMGCTVSRILPLTDQFEVTCSNGRTYNGAAILIAMGGNPNQDSYSFVAELGHTIINPIPSLFTFNDPAKKFADLMGLAVVNAEARISTTKYSSRGPILITHWGLSGPAIIRLSAWAAEYLHEKKYQFTVSINWTNHTEDEMRNVLSDQKHKHGKQRVYSNAMFSIPLRLWQRLCDQAEIEETKIWSELPQRNVNKLIENLIRCSFDIKGKTTFKEEFVTCGGIDLRDIDMQTMESKLISNLFFAGEVINVDGETGGFNFQAAWSTANAAAVAFSKR